MDFIIITALLILAMAAYSYRKSSKEKDKRINDLISKNDNLYNQLTKSRKDFKQEMLKTINDYNSLKNKLMSDCELEKAMAVSERNNAIQNCEQEKVQVIADYNQLKKKLTIDCETEKAKAIADYQSKKEELVIDYTNAKTNFINEYNKTVSEIKQEKDIVINKYNQLISEHKKKEEAFLAHCQKEEARIAECDKQITEREKLFNMKVKDISVLARFVSDLEFQRDGSRVDWLLDKKRPAVKASELVNDIRHEKLNLNIKLKKAEYLLKYYEQLVPWLTEVDDDYLDPELNKTGNLDFDDNKDAASYWLSKDEFTKLTTQEKYQLALDRYKKRNKSNAEIGRDFERYIGYQYEMRGYAVEYRGIVDGFEDRGRDLLCHKNNATLVVQCKYWSKQKTIHENHINQLFGTTVKYFLEKHPQATFIDFFSELEMKTIIPVFVTSTKLSDTAKEFAASLNITVVENKTLGDYPIIKCNVNKNTGEKIYHLPFDQQYDKVKISGKGECYAMTIAEAEAKGFRRAKKWLGE